jgi:hypothetical protein
MECSFDAAPNVASEGKKRKVLTLETRSTKLHATDGLIKAEFVKTSRRVHCNALSLDNGLLRWTCSCSSIVDLRSMGNQLSMRAECLDGVV